MTTRGFICAKCLGDRHLAQPSDAVESPS